MASNKQLNKITLKGSAAIVSEFFFYGINNILYQRGVYPPEMFKQEKKYGLTILTTTDPNLLTYLNENVLPQLTEWIEQGVVKRLVVVIRECETNETLERWQFEIECQSDGKENSNPKSKDISVINSEIRAVIRQITATVTFLPLLEVPCSFDLLFYTNHDLVAPEHWEDSSACLINNSEVVKLRSFSTSVHKVDGAVSYKFSM
uniref:mitotic spindle assembly checkpoint protein MAD2A n=1 Tax=Ciona intestinalis TaxID=7719 RepID=UPI00005225B8|nr:mitotic spindle assembly checkpoint protein MAD2A [Ciona intestinalis]|eukprot:XP_002131760.1 mitotic spindle assembly checkpoint protein MAD2A [Ciona intestinalis]